MQTIKIAIITIITLSVFSLAFAGFGGIDWGRYTFGISNWGSGDTAGGGATYWESTYSVTGDWDTAYGTDWDKAYTTEIP